MSRGRRPRTVGDPNRAGKNNRPAGSYGEAPKCPEYLGQYGRELWAQLAPPLEADGLLTPLSATGLEVLCGLYNRYRLTELSIDEDGIVVAGKANPMIRASAILAGQIRQLLTEYSATPGSAGRTVLPPLK